jgi:hypothetical protein
VVAPTLGAIVPGWLIIVPRKAALNFRHWHEKQLKSPEAVIGEVLTHLGLAAEDIIWFEHVPCGAQLLDAEWIMRISMYY